MVTKRTSPRSDSKNKESKMAETREWPTWIRYSMSAIFGAGAALVGMTIAYSDVVHTASSAQTRAISNSEDIKSDVLPRIRMLEQQKAADIQWKRGVKETLDRIEHILERDR